MGDSVGVEDTFEARDFGIEGSRFLEDVCFVGSQLEDFGFEGFDVGFFAFAVGAGESSVPVYILDLGGRRFQIAG